jgi:hypothetical protein
MAGSPGTILFPSMLFARNGLASAPQAWFSGVNGIAKVNSKDAISFS